jgi:hypothetical protein
VNLLIIPHAPGALPVWGLGLRSRDALAMLLLITAGADADQARAALDQLDFDVRDDSHPFSSGALGWYAGGKVTVKVGDKRVRCQVRPGRRPQGPLESLQRALWCFLGPGADSARCCDPRPRGANVESYPMRCPLKTPSPADAIEEAHRWAYHTRERAVVLVDVVGDGLEFTVVIGPHEDYLTGRTIVYVVRSPKRRHAVPRWPLAAPALGRFDATNTVRPPLCKGKQCY